MKTVFLVNPQAGNGSGRRTWRKIGATMAGDSRFDAVVTSDLTEARKIAAQAVGAHIDRLVVVGGDGSLNAVIGELAYSDTALGVIPAGTGNDFYRGLGVPFDPLVALKIATGQETRRIDLGQVAGGQYFLNVAGVGFDAEVAAATSRFRLGNALPYLLGTVSTLFWYQPTHAVISIDDRQFSGIYMLTAIANGSCYGGGMRIAPTARFDDGTLDVCLVGDLGRLELLNLLPHVYAGTHVRHPKVRIAKGQRIHIQVGKDVRAHLDGEAQFLESLDFRVCPGVLSVALPDP